MSNVKTYFKKRVNRNLISARISISGEPTFEVTTKISTPKGSDLRIERGRILIGEHQKIDDLNDELYDFKRKVRDLSKKLELVHGEISAIELQNALADGEVRAFTMRDILKKYSSYLELGKVENVKTGRPISPRTLRTKRVLIRQILKALSSTKNLDLGKYNYKTSEVIGKNKVTLAYREFWKGLVDVLHNNNLDANTINSYSGEIKRAVRHVVKDSELFVEPFLAEFKYQKIVYKRELLESDQYDFLINNYDMILNQCSPHLKRVYQYAYVALWTCARSRDMKLWTKSNLTTADNGITWLTYTTSKGGVDVSIPLKDTVIEIFNKSLERRDKLMPVIEDNLSDGIKRITKRYPLFQREIKTTRIKGGVKVEESVPVWKLLTLHKMRGSGMTAMRRKGIPDNVIKQWSSHTENSAAYSLYFQTEKKELLEKATAFYG